MSGFILAFNFPWDEVLVNTGVRVWYEQVVIKAQNKMAAVLEEEEGFVRRCVREGFSHREISHQLQAKYPGEQL